MKDLARVGNHPIHPMLVAFPVGLWIFSLVADIIYRAGGPDAWSSVAFYAVAGGIVGAILAAVPGFIDYLGMKAPNIKKVALWHMLLNVSALVVFSISFFLRRGDLAGTGAFVLSITGVAFIIVSGWLGGHMVYVQGMAVDESEVCVPGHGPELHHGART